MFSVAAFAQCRKSPVGAWLASVGVVARLSSTVSVYLAADYNTNLDTNTLEGVSGNAGVRLSW